MSLPSADALMSDAEARTRLSDWGWFDIRKPLEALVTSVNAEANLFAKGERACAERLGFVLANRLRMINDRKRWPAIAQEEIRSPLIIPGLPRSGTTMLSRLLGEDPVNRSPLLWEILAPSPPPESESRKTDPRIAQVEDMLNRHGFTRPELMAIHPFGASFPEECVFICEHAMTMAPYGAFWNTPSYLALTMQADMRAVFRVHREVLQHLQFRCDAERWVLKNPAAMGILPAFVDVYPDAKFVMTHRDPGRIIPSLAKLFGVLRRTFTDDPAKADIAAAAKEQLVVWSMALEAMTEFRKRPGMNERFVDLDYKTTLADPIASVEKIYSHFGLELRPDAKARMEAWLAQNRQGRHGAHDYSLAECDLTQGDIEAHFGAYMERYAVTREKAP